VQEFCNGGDLRTAIDAGMFARQRQCSWQRVMTALRHIVDALDTVHSRRICHGTLSPSSILLSVRRPTCA
jgi:serine/threonine protein kinase